MRNQAVWSAGQGDFLNMGLGAQKQPNRDTALAGATGISSGAAASVPGAFFHMNWGNQLGGAAVGDKRVADEKVGDVSCYVLSHERQGQISTLWIGQQDFLIHQVRTFTSAAAMKAVLDEAAKTHPMMASMAKFAAQDVTSTETHTHIVVNPALAPAAFNP